VRTKGSWIALLSVAALLVAGGSGFGRAPEDAVRQKRPMSELPIQVYQGYLPVVEGSIGPMRELKFALDTGTSHTVVDKRIADALALQRRPVRAFGLGSTVHLDLAQLPEIDFGPQRATNLNVLVGDLRTFQSLGVKVDAVIGLDLLERQNFSLDLIRKRIAFGQITDTARSVPLVADGNSLRVALDVGGRLVWMLVDTGASGVMFYEDDLKNLSASYRILSEVPLRSASGLVDSRTAIVPRLRLGTQDLDRRVRLIATPTTGPVLHVAGYVGLDALGAKQIDFDFENERLRWK
jgi:predicted aspartyl protease